MLFAYTKEKEMISAVESDNQQQFFCPDCGEELIRKAGKIKIPHFAHSQNTECYGLSDGGIVSKKPGKWSNHYLIYRNVPIYYMST